MTDHRPQGIAPENEATPESLRALLARVKREAREEEYLAAQRTPSGPPSFETLLRTGGR